MSAQSQSPVSDLAAINHKFVAPGEVLPEVRLKNGDKVQTGTIAAMLQNVALYNAGQADAIRADLRAAVPTLVKVGLFELFPPQEWLAGNNPGRAFVGQIAQEYFAAQASGN